MTRKRIILFLLLGVLLFAGYMYKYQQLVNESYVLDDERCQNVEPLIDEKKRVGFDVAEALTASDSARFGFLAAKHQDLIYQYLPLAEHWLAKRKEFLNRQDVNLIISRDVRDTLWAQYEKYKIDYESNQATLAYYKDPASEKNIRGMVEALQKMDQAQKTWDEKDREVKNRFNIRHFFVTVPPSKCTYDPTEPVGTPFS